MITGVWNAEVNYKDVDVVVRFVFIKDNNQCLFTVL